MQYGLIFLLLAVLLVVVIGLHYGMPRSPYGRAALGIVTVVGGCGMLYQLQAQHSICWQEEIGLTDGGSIWLDREVEVGLDADLVPTGLFASSNVGGKLAFTHPASGEKLTWHVPDGLRPVLFDIDGSAVYLLSVPLSPAQWRCPSPPYVLFVFRHGVWQREAVETLPRRFDKKNMLGYLSAKTQRQIAEHGHRVSRALVAHHYATQGDQRATIDRRYTNPARDASGCWQLEKYPSANGEHIERRPVEEAYGSETTEKLRQHWQATRRSYLTDLEAFELGIVNAQAAPSSSAAE